MSHHDGGEAMFRNMTPYEVGILAKLLDGADFQGCREIQDQVSATLACTIDENRSLKLRPGREAPSAHVAKRIPVEAEAEDSDGTTIHFLLHVLSGYIEELEIFKDDGSQILSWPESEDLRVLVLE